MPARVLRDPRHDGGAAGSGPGPLADAHGRIATDLRVSVIDKCNLRCTYCMPAHGLPFLPGADLLTRDEIGRLVRLAVERFGVDQVRFTGGEPLVRADLADIVADSAALTPRPDVSITTNGLDLARQAPRLKHAGVDRFNVSLDSIDADTYRELTRRPLLEKVLAGIDSLTELGYRSTKVNAVLLPGVNEHQAVDLLDWALSGGHQLRFIEQMPLDADHGWSRESLVTAARIRELLAERFDLEPAAVDRGGAPAELYDVRMRAGRAVVGRVGIIASVTEPFCAACTRTRITADGRVRSCLFSHEETDLRELLRSAATDDDLELAWRRAMWAKPAGHRIAEAGFEQPLRTMSAIGG